MNKPLKKEEKSAAIEGMLENISAKLGTPRSAAFKTQTCVLCSGKADNFKDTVSEREYSLSGMCQDCQDNIWG